MDLAEHFEGRHGCAGASRAAKGGLGGPPGAPHLDVDAAIQPVRLEGRR